MRNAKGNIIWGILFILVGIGFAGKIFGIWDLNFHLFDGWWTMFIIVPSCINLMNRGPRKGNIIGLAVGLLLLLDQLNIFKKISVFDLSIPVILIAIGISFFFKSNGKDEN